MVGKGVVFVDGHYCSSSSIPASAVYHEAGVLQITPASTNPALTDDAAKKGWNNVFRVCGRDDAQGAVAGKYLADHYKGKNVAIIHDKTAYGKGLADETKKAANKLGVKEAMYEAINQGDKDFTALVSKMKQANIDVIYFGGYQTEAGLIVRQARDQGLKAPLIGGDALVTEEFWKITGPAGEGTLMTFAPDPRKVPAAKAVVDRFMAQGYNPEGYTLYTYAAIQAFKDGGGEGQVGQARRSVEGAEIDEGRHRDRHAAPGTKRATSPTRNTSSMSGRTANTPRCNACRASLDSGPDPGRAAACSSARRLHRDVEHHVGQDLAQDAAQGRLVGGRRRGEQPARAAAQDARRRAPFETGADRREHLGRLDPPQHAASAPAILRRSRHRAPGCRKHRARPPRRPRPRPPRPAGAAPATDRPRGRPRYRSATAIPSSRRAPTIR